MKTLLIMLLAVFTLTSYAQKNEEFSPGRDFKVNTADSLKGDAAHRTITLYGNVDFESGKLKVKADEVFIDQKTNLIVVTGMKDLHFDGAVVFSKGTKNKILKYTIGDNKVLIE